MDWDAQGVNIRKEFGKANEPTGGRLLIHDYLRRDLNRPERPVVFYDHRTGEVADFLTLHVEAGKTVVSLYHCKASKGAGPGDRLEDVYEVCGQVIKSFNMVSNPPDLVKHVKRRSRSGSEFVRDDLATFEAMMRDGFSRGLVVRLIAVQPGASRDGLTEDVLSVLGAANEYVHQLGLDDLRVLGSA